MEKDTSFDHKYLKIEPSIFAGDFGNLASEAKKIEDAGADALHFDIMDGHFVPNLTLGPKALAAVRKAAKNIFLDVHIMVYNPFDYIEPLIASGADQITFHVEATEDIEDCINYIKKAGKKVGLALCPDTSLSLVMNYVEKCDMVLLMTVNPGFGGQAFIPSVLDKIADLRNVCNKLQLKKDSSDPKVPIDIQVDGGINYETAKQCVQAGANVLVAGTYLFQDDMKERIALLKQL